MFIRSPTTLFINERTNPIIRSIPMTTCATDMLQYSTGVLVSSVRITHYIHVLIGI